MRLAGTARQYSKNAMPQLASTATHIAAAGNLSWPYQAVVMNRLEQQSSTIGRIAAVVSGMGLSVRRGAPCRPGRTGAARRDWLTGRPPRVNDAACWFPRLGINRECG